MGVFLTVLEGKKTVDMLAEEDQEYFQQVTDNNLEQIQERMETYGQVLRGLKALFVASKHVSRSEFQRYTQELELLQNYPGILGIAFAVQIEPDEVDPYTAQIRAEGFPGFTLFPEGEREQYTAIQFIEPFSGNNLKAFGFDMYSESVRREAMDRARLSGDLALSGKVSLVQDADRGPIAGVLLYLALYQGSGSQTEVNTDEVLGWVYAPFSMDILMEGIQLDRSRVDFSIYDGSSVSAEAHLYSSTDKLKKTTQLSFQRTEQLRIAQRTWTVVFASDGIILEHESPELIPVLFGGGLLTVLMTLLVWSLSSGKKRAEAKAASKNRELQETEFRLKSALSGAGHGVWDWNNRTNEVTFDANWKSMLGYGNNEIKNDFSEWQRLIHPFDRECAEAAINEFLNRKSKTYSLEHRLRTRDGQWKWILSRGDIVSWTEEGQPARTIGTHTDITERKSLELALSESEQRFREAFETAAVGMALVGLNGEWLEANPSLLEMLQYSQKELQKLTFQDITHPDDLNLDLEQLSELTAGKIRSYQMDKRYFRKDGSIFWIRLSAAMVKDGDGNPIHYVALIEDINERVRLQQQILHQASHDSLTGLPNRWLLDDRLVSVFSLSRRKKRPFALMYIDVDHFKQVNDIHGHDVGDKLLNWLANRISACIRVSDTLARQGGDEFVLILTDINEPGEAELIACKILNEARGAFDGGHVQLQVSLSIGMAVYDPVSSDSVDDLLKKADIALYRVKRAGRNGYRIYQDEDE